MIEAPGRPGIRPRWTSSAKSGVGTALSDTSRVWFTISHGILNEVYYPRVDQACIRDLGLIVTDGASFFAEEKRDCSSTVELLEDGVPAFLLTSTHKGGRFRIVKRVIADPRSCSVLMQIRLEDLGGAGLRLFALCAPHLVNGGAHNNGWRGDHKGRGMLFASGGGTYLAMAADQQFAASSVGFVGVSDGWQQLSKDRRLSEQYDFATDGNIAMTAELARGADGSVGSRAGFGLTQSEAGYHALASLQTPFETIVNDYAAGWRAWQAGLRSIERRAHGHNLYRVSTAILRSHEAPTFPGGLIASLSIPWGFSKGDDDLGGYHLVWPRDLCETGGALLACGADAHVRRYPPLPAGDTGARRILAAELLARRRALLARAAAGRMRVPDAASGYGLALGRVAAPGSASLLAHGEKAAAFVILNGPRTKQDRWEENAGYTPFTLAVAVASLLAAAEIAEALDIASRRPCSATPRTPGTSRSRTGCMSRSTRAAR